MSVSQEKKRYSCHEYVIIVCLGGTIGFFTGASLLSLFDLIYKMGTGIKAKRVATKLNWQKEPKDMPSDVESTSGMK